MALALNKILIAGTQVNTPGAYFQGAANVYATTAGNVVPAGTYYVTDTPNVTIQVATAYNSTSNVTTWSNVSSSGYGGLVISDGVNVQLLATSNANVVVVTVDGGQAVSGTYNAS
jgi:hypothetical protein